MIVPDSTNLFFAELARQIELAAEERGYHILLCNSGEDTAREQAHLEALRQQRVDGVLLIPSDTIASNPKSTGYGIPIVALDRSPLISAQHIVRTAPEAGGALAVDHLVALGHRHIGFAHGPLRLSHARQRLEGGIAALQHYGLLPLPEWLIECNFDFAGGWHAAQMLLAQSSYPTAICCGNDAIAVGLLAGLHAAGIVVPEVFSIVGFDDIPLARYAIPPLTTIAQPYAAMAQRALNSLLVSACTPSSEVTPETEEVLPVTLVQRRSTAPPSV
ncbi:MAG: substrate-binding domain-containing protein [Chloroflexi bacterium]|nr:substrate-binding domain-containing protein [Chloroflexota bacterium]